MISDTIYSEIKYLLDVFGIKNLTAIQKIAIPKILSHELDIVVVAPTGSGKTEAVIIPLLHKILSNNSLKIPGIKVLYLTPLRALNRDIFYRLHKASNRIGSRIAVWHGDTTASARRKILASPPDILVTTPESLQVLLIKDEIRNRLKSLHAVVIDEAQELASSERGAELAVALERLDNAVRRHVRRILISAPVGDIDTVARYFLSGRRYDAAIINKNKEHQISVSVIGDEYRDGVIDAETIHHSICKFISDIPGKQVLVFTNTRTTAEELGLNLSRCLGNSIALHHSSLSRSLREVVESMFKRGDVRIVVATSSLELGIDIGGVDVVVQYLSPRQAVKLIQRVGRSGHRELAVSRGIILVPPIITELLESIVLARRALNYLLENPQIHIEPLDVVAHQVVGIVLEKKNIDVFEIWRIISNASPFSMLTMTKLRSVIDFLNSIGLIKCSNDICRPTKKGMVYYLTTNMIPDAVHYEIKSVLNGEVVGLLDEEFALACSENDIIVLGGKLWKVVGIMPEKRELIVAPIESSELVVLPKWLGELIPVYRNVAREVCAFVRRFCSAVDEAHLNKLMNEYGIDENVRNFLMKYRNTLCDTYPRDDMLVIELYNIPSENKTLIAFYTCLGSKASEAFSLLLIYVVREVLGVSPPYKSHQLGTVMLINSLVTKEHIQAIIKRLHQLAKSPEDIKKIIDSELKDSSLFKYRIVSVAKKLGIIGADVGASELRRIVNSLATIDLAVQETLRELYTEKIDVDDVIKYLDMLAQNKLRIKVKIRRSASPYLVELSSLSIFRSLAKRSLIPKDIAIELAKRRLLDRRITLFCTSCYHQWDVILSQAVEKCSNLFSCFIECPKCRSRAVTIVDEGGKEEIALLRKILDKIRKSDAKTIKLFSHEKNVLEKHRKIIDFVMTYGIAGLIAIQGIGIGIETAKRVIARSSDLDSLISNIIEQEKVFIRTSKYWRSS